MKRFSDFRYFFPLIIFFSIFTHVYSQVPVVVNDTVDITPGIPVTADILANDYIHPGDSIKIIFTSPGFNFLYSTVNADMTVTFILDHWGYTTNQVRGYVVRDFTAGTISQKGLILFRIRDHSSGHLDINNVNALFSSSGLHFFHDSAQYEIPRGSGKTSLFSNSVWIGGMDPGNVLHFAGERYRQGTGNPAWVKHDYWAGPVSDSAGYNSIQDTIWNRIWKLNKTEIDYHRAHFWEAGYVAPENILTWPAHGDVTLGQAANLAPFSDRNGNGKYEPYDGDYPEIRGDQTLFFIYNDDHGYHSESTGEKLRIEIHAMAYAFNRPGDTAFKNTTFLHCKFYNRSNYTYTDSWIGVYTDIDLGYPNDDYLGCDPERGMYYGYNGMPVDGKGQSNAYGENPPVQAVVILGGPLLNPDGYDNPSFRGSTMNGPSFKGSCNIVSQNGTLQNMKYGPGEIYEASFLVRSEAINGLHFGDGIPDNERLGMRRFVYHNNANAGVPTSGFPYPLYAPEYYQVMNGFMKDGSKMIYGGNGHLSAGGYGPECDYMFPGLTDTCNWGMAGELPNGPKEWTEKTAMNIPQDRRGTSSTGPFTFHPGTTQELDLAFAWARCYNSPDSACMMQKINSVVDTIRRSFSRNSLPGGGLIYGFNNHPDSRSSIITIYPNPADRQVNIRYRLNADGAFSAEIRDLNGILLKQIGPLSPGSGIHETTMTTANIPSGIYLLKINCGVETIIRKLVVGR